MESWSKLPRRGKDSFYDLLNESTGKILRDQNRMLILFSNSNTKLLFAALPMYDTNISLDGGFINVAS